MKPAKCMSIHLDTQIDGHDWDLMTRLMMACLIGEDL